MITPHMTPSRMRPFATRRRTLTALAATCALTLLYGTHLGAAEAATPTCLGHAATKVGTPGHDVIVGTAGPDVIVTYGGGDRVYGLGGNDLICTGSGNDSVYGGDGADRISTDSGNDVIHGGNGDDTIVSGSGNDTDVGDAGNDRISGGDGADHEDGSLGDDVNLPLPTLLNRLDELDPQRPIVVYCAGGYRSATAASLLRASGFATVAELLGGYNAALATPIPATT